MKKPNAKKTAAKKTAAAKEGKKRGRPAMSAEQKAAKAAEKNKAKGETRKAAAAAVTGAPDANPKLRAIFLNHLPKVAQFKKRIASVTGELRNLYKEAEKDGFTKDQFETALLCQDPEGEAKIREKIAKTLQAAGFVGSALGNQLDLFGQPDRTPLVDRAKDEGRMASMQNKAALPPYDPNTEAYRAYMDGFHEHQAKIAAEGFRQTGQAAPNGKTPKAAKTPPPAPQPPPGAGVTSGVAVTRSQLKAQQEALKQQQQQASPPSAPVGEDDDDDGSFERMPVAGAA